MGEPCAFVQLYTSAKYLYIIFFSLSQYTLLPLNQLNTEANNTLKWLPTRQAQTIQFQTGFN